MNLQLQTIQEFIQLSPHLSLEDKEVMLQAINNVDRQLTIIEFKLDRTEKVKRTTAILLEETIDELEQKRKAVEETNSALKKSLEELKTTQSQLIQSEKMASLGELTAGIAHEIQNPLNFVNNFSEVSVDLVDEMNDEIETGNTKEVIAIARDLKQNLNKINHHGQRASFIVRGMLEHSRTSTGEKKPTDINVLAEEFLKLSYHGLLAKDKSFNADFATEFDKDLPFVNVVAQDIGRVILNLINNAFYAVSDRDHTVKARQALSQQEYKPLVTVTTKNLGSNIEICVKDNGNGIPEDIKDKIFQPFYTTKPTGLGTGLGLSMSYDIITKGHGGEIKLETKQGKGSEFVIVLPVKLNKEKKLQML